ncbi:hypothetical protein GCM10027275_09130 [Rhabdobacter roseus]|uniref:Uncharacterized protein n=1 Tax=Rhabdobacter roseus TaxID=1655419 RepID=A0A840TNM3_9BACT|nr:hypothetical protein [Rhabdobacter roseus]MBB5282813.1 hypothetical protein [Rhabdobacter roseus]
MDSVLINDKKAANERRRKRGLLSAGLGAAVLGVGFLTQYILYRNDLSFDAVMYSLTLLGIGLIFYAAVQFFS